MSKGFLKSIVFLLALLPLLLLIRGFFTNDLTANPVEYLLRQTGYWGLVLLFFSLAVTPARRLFRWKKIVSLRRMLGLFSFAYIGLHFLIYLFLDRELYWDEIIPDIVKRPYITIGFSAFLAMIPLAVTSTKGWMKRLGKGWQKLHRLTYVIAVAGVVHYWWQVKADIRQPALFAVILLILFALRLKRKSPAG
ncbi:MAG TPA: sulfoxide reductase heme-binding subunit YedZ [Caldithrix abyssi]|uniref:Protein-methionine-sulfoxide reductase heme-binding subunit MsrQ n=1 Tax=Caldithrix abyssi TaxID=187145 RepID=A0A7V1PVF3_CALAY|nr:sulfoxide reductase heme-binding subunit YedZ [Caldithrix abyssi]